MTTLDTGQLPGPTGAPGGVGEAVATQSASGSILELLHEVDSEDGVRDFQFQRQQLVLNEPKHEKEGVAAPDMIPDPAAGDSLLVFDRITREFGFWKGWVEFTDEALSDNRLINRERIDAAIMVPARNRIGGEIVAPTADMDWRDVGFVQSPAIEVEARSGNGRSWIAQAVDRLSDAMERVSLAKGAAPRFQACLSPQYCNSLRKDVKLLSFMSAGQLTRVVEQSYGFGMDSGDLAGIVGIFAPDTAYVEWKMRPTIAHGQIGDQIRTRRGGARAGARLGLAVISPVAFCRLVVA